MTHQPQFTFCTALVDALVANGVRHAAVSPGSRNTPLLLALGAHPGIEVSVHHDERTGAFFALGLAKATGVPTVLCCTSGTAATEYLPAITEARMSHTPLIALTADRPPELQDRGAPQTINQTNLYGTSAKWFFDTGVPESDVVADATHLGRQAVATSIEAPAGPIHINVPLREPLVPDFPNSPRPVESASLPTVTKLIADERVITATADLINTSDVAYVAGHTNSPGAGAAILDLAERSGGIVLADPQSDARFSGVHHPNLISLADLLLSAAVDIPPPSAIVHFGAIHTSKPVNQHVARWGVPVVHVHDGQWQDPLGVATSVVVADPATTANQLAKLAAPPSADRFAEQWRLADDAAISTLDTIPGDTEPQIANVIINALPAASTLVVGSSMPIRLVDSYGSRRESPLRVIANRGANGIDGTIATAVGVAAAGKSVTAFIGDLTALADVGSLAAVAATQLPVTIVVLNNDGGGIFDFLPQADSERVSDRVYRDLIRVPHGHSLVPIASAFGIEATAISTVSELQTELREVAEGPRLLEIAVAPGTGPAARRGVIDSIRA